jgi:ABC-2 type transport system permease protein
VPGWLGAIFGWLSLDYHFESFRKGLFDSRDAVYYLVLILGSLTFTTRVLLLRRFR